MNTGPKYSHASLEASSADLRPSESGFSPVGKGQHQRTAGRDGATDDEILAGARVLCLAYAEHRARRAYEAAKASHAPTARLWRRWAMAKAALVGASA